MQRNLFHYLQEDATAISHYLLKNYARIGLSDQEMMLVVHLLAFKTEGKGFPTVQELEGRMAADGSTIISVLQRVVQKEYVEIKDYYDEDTGVRYEHYSFEPLYRRIAKVVELENLKEQEAKQEAEKEQQSDLYSKFEQEFGRPLTPIECETLAMWMEQDKHSEELVEAALREAVVSGKLYFRYIDRILYEWSRNHIRTPRDAREYSMRFRKHQQQKKGQDKPSAAAGKAQQNGDGQQSFPFFNWLEYDESQR